MSNKRILFGLLIGITHLFTAAFAQTQPDPKTKSVIYSNEFLKIGVGARAMGMGRTMCATADDVTAGYWNPAGLVGPNASKSPEVSLMYASYFANVTNYNYAAFSIPIDSTGTRRFGVSLVRLGVDNIPNTLEMYSNGVIDFNKVRSFSTSDFATILSYAWQPKAIKGLSVGTNMKIVYRGVGRFANAWGFGLDVAARYQIKNFRVGINVLDATQTYNMWTFNTETFQDAFIQTGNAIPQNSVEITKPTVRTGLAYKINIGNSIGVLLATDADVTFDGARNTLFKSESSGISIDPRAGIELSYNHASTGKPLAFLRGGVYNIQKEKNIDGKTITTVAPSVGVGVCIKNFKIDYAIAKVGDSDLRQASHIVSLGFLIPSKL